MSPELEQLLALQECDVELDRLAGVARGIDEREKDLDRERATLVQAATRAREQLAIERQRERDLQRAAQEHRELQNKFASQMDAVRKAKEAAAATTQLEIAQRVVATDEQQLKALQGRVRDLEQAAELHEMELAEIDEKRKEDREAIAADRAKLNEQVEAARALRAERAKVIARQLLSRYDRLRSRGHATVLVKLDGMSCGNCRTAIPMQRRNELMSGRKIEPCEGCGVLLYATG